uniref:LARGE xylosyl- and glucuronyltransferase 2-like n=1 Tax=Ciona intestinalis TaxID=7719 RepID=UPI000180D058|nr:LARGE xylosyl- and glucuronyltransferase 2-like [Ciona intestinalis]|eukprot:XP_002128775.1 LARGE xylosyl- and glucuronyltransferase 2-like [Ciona intestinalis]
MRKNHKHKILISICIFVFIATICRFYFKSRSFNINYQNKEAIVERNKVRHAPRNTETAAYIAKKDCTTVHICIVCAGYTASRQVVTLIKSLLFYRTSKLHVHFIVNGVSRTILRNLFQTWDIPHFVVSFYQASDFIDEVSWIPNKHYSGVYGLMKLTILTVLPANVGKIIVLDTDLIFAHDVTEIWQYFDKFGENEAIGLVENQSDWYLGTLWENYTPWPAIGRGFNTGLILLDCMKLRAIEWQSKWKEVAQTDLKHFLSTALADQDIINSVLSHNASLLHVLPCYWNLQLSDHMRMDLCYKQHKHEVKVIHWNTRRKQNNRHDENIKSLTDVFRTFTEINGAFLRHPRITCSTDDPEIYQSLDDTDFDMCSDLISSAASLHRTHIFYLPFDYHSNSATDVSIIVHLTIDRLTVFEAMCKHWEGPISAAFFTTDAEAQTLVDFVKLSPVLMDRTNIGYHIVYKNSNHAVYPINLLRNVALKQAVTDHVFLYDVDFVPMPGLFTYLTSYLAEHAKSPKTAYIVPAFESFWYKFKVPQTKSVLHKQIDRGVFTSFRSYMWPQGHAATNFSRWKTAKEAYPVRWETNFEPYVVVKKQNLPLYDQAFIGFGWNKISHIIELDAAGYQFVVLPFGFIIHIPHAPSVDLSKFRSSPSYRECLNIAKEAFYEKLRSKYHKTTGMSKYFT